MRILFAVHDFFPPKHLLQPRAYLYRLGLAATAKGHSVTFLTDSASDCSIDGIDVAPVSSLSKRSRPGILEGVAPDVIVWSTSYLNILGNSRLYSQLPRPVVGFLACPSYGIGYLTGLIPRLGTGPLRYYFLNALAGHVSGRRLLSTRHFAAFISQSKDNLQKLLAVPGHRRIHLPPGLDHRQWFPEPAKAERKPSAARRVLFFGPARKSRGLYVLLGAYQKCVEQHPKTELHILLRDGDEAKVDDIRYWLSSRGLDQQAVVAGGWASPETLRKSIWDADIVVIPMLMPESDSPISVLEAKACGRPVLSSAVAGIPDLIGSGGIALSSCSASAFADQICRLIEQPLRLRELREHAIDETRVHPSWEDTCDTFISWLGQVSAD
jgi:glycosyltransferase involved in cell wall biosynthesis